MGGTAGFAVVVFGALGGVVAYLAGVVGLRELRRLRRVGVPALALVRARVPTPEDRALPPRPLLQFETADGRVMEVFSPSRPPRATRCRTAATCRSATTRPIPGRSWWTAASAGRWSTPSWRSGC